MERVSLAVCSSGIQPAGDNSGNQVSLFHNTDTPPGADQSTTVRLRNDPTSCSLLTFTTRFQSPPKVVIYALRFLKFLFISTDSLFTALGFLKAALSFSDYQVAL